MILSETLIDMKIAEMLKQQKALLDEGLDINEDGDIVKVKKEWDASVWTNLSAKVLAPRLR